MYRDEFLGARSVIWQEVLRRKARPVRVRNGNMVTYKFHPRYLERLLLTFPQAERSEGVERLLALIEQEDSPPVPDLDVPGMDGELWDFQKIGVQKLVDHRRFFLNDEMGLGKTIQALAALAIKDAFPTLCVVPNNAKHTWERMIDKFFPLITYATVGNNSRQRQEAMAAEENILICHYEALRLPDMEELFERHWETLIADEYHRIKNPNAKQTKAFHKIKAKNKWFMSGTPILNGRAEELWSPLKAAFPSHFDSYYLFCRRYCNPGEAPIWMGDLSFQRIDKVQAGDEVVGWIRGREGRRPRRRLAKATVTDVNHHIAPVVKVYLESGKIIRCTADHLWLAQYGVGKYEWLPTKVGRSLGQVIEPTPELPSNLHRAAGWLGGIWDGEGSGYGIAQSPIANPEVHWRIGQYLDVLGFDYTEREAHDWAYCIRGGRQAYVNFLNWCKPAKHKKMEWMVLGTDDPTAPKMYSQGHGGGNVVQGWEKVVRIEPDGEDDVYSLTTTTGNYVAWGYASKNCIFNGYKVIGYRNLGELKDFFMARSIRRRKSQILADLPEKVYSARYVTLTNEQRKLYNEIRDEMILWLDDGTHKTVNSVLARTTRLKQACFSPELYQGSPVSAKLDELKEIVEELTASGEKALIFSQWSKATRILQRELAQYNPAYVDGSIPLSKRTAEQDRFNDDEECQLYIGTIGANRESITLSAATYVIFTDKGWTPAENEQALSRSAAGGLRGLEAGVDKVHIIELQALDTLEERIEALLEKKRRLNNLLVERDGGDRMDRMTIQSIRDIL